MTIPPVDLAVILAGGLSRRMGRDKATALLAGRPLVDHVIGRLAPQVGRLMVNTSAPLDLPCPRLPDTRPDRPGPLAGILAAMREANRLGLANVMTAPVDTPFLPHDLAARLAAAAQSGTVIVASSGGRVHPVVAIWPSVLADDLESWLADPDNRRLTDFMARHPRVEVDFPMKPTSIGDADPFFNVNDADDLSRAEQLLETDGWD